jgi:2-polyprenyl-3-methyl-5-hydroxy-6-metoxy-1,4-benzoquinol methylase
MTVQAGMGTSPFRPEPPRRNLLVDAVMAAARGRAAASESPHLHGGDHQAKLRYEYEAADVFWRALEPHVRIADLEGGSILDVGCGWGGKTLRYAESARLTRITGIDLPGVYDPSVPRRYAEEHGIRNCRFVEGAAEAMPFEPDSFDIALMDDVMEHVANPQAVLRECARVLRPGGLLLVKFPSIRMMRAHHLDRAIAVPGLHWMLSLRTWAGGLNDYLARHTGSLTYEPFDEVVRSRFGHRWVTSNLNGLDYASFAALVEASPFRTRHLGIEVSPPVRLGFRRRRLRLAFRALSSRPALRERLGTSVVFVGELRGSH